MKVDAETTSFEEMPVLPNQLILDDFPPLARTAGNTLADHESAKW